MATIALTGAASMAAQAQSCTSLDDLQWLLGSWHYQDASKQMMERWQRVSAHTFEGIGASETENSGGDRDIEILRLTEMSGEIFYLAKVSHNALPVAFKMTACRDNEAVFENPEHDFPSRLEYRLLDPNRLRVSVAGTKGKRFILNFRRPLQ
ncbi:hypothetical protein SAMN04487965_1954 [Microbulbifer donghaiensis]|uniref:DUF6265 domain-containing protein n=1 Tax=Microbulbifer donghaiensis TaxID=494016 RepID=A0A1M5AS14_9GAMM|nr:DUF6265 family protein [Microbulbifer donghaiensis]SHF33058.1 hypothetical protein SAMN04487965_1954 [Microbulbifer donghaiensis]